MHEGLFATRGRMVPLPPGRWVAFSRHAWQGGEISSNFSHEDVGLARVTPLGVDALIHIRTTDLEAGAHHVRSWGRDPACNRTDTHFIQVISRDERDQACMMLNHVQRTATVSTSQVWADYAGLREGRDAQFPDTMLGATYRVARGTGATTLTYYFSVRDQRLPAEPGISWASSAWHPSRADAPRLAVVERYRAWTTTNFEPVRQGVEQGRRGTSSATP